MAQRKKRYRLYAMGRTRKTEEIAYDSRFYRICAGYILLYLTGRKKPEGAVEVAGADLDRLTDGDRLWLADCNSMILAEPTSQSGVKQDEAEKQWASTLERLELELEKERERMKGGGEHGPAN